MIKRYWQFIRQKKRWALGVLIVVIGIGYGVWTKRFSQEESTDFFSTEYEVQTGEISTSLSLAGTTKFANAQKLTFVQQGKVTSVKVKVGDQVKKGQVLASISTDKLDTTLERNKRDLNAKKRAYEKKLKDADSGLDLLKAQAEYDQKLLEQTLLPQKQTSETETAQIAVENAKQNLKDQEKALKDLQDDYAIMYGTGKNAQNSDLGLSKTAIERNQKFEAYVREFKIQALSLQSILDGYDRVMQETKKFLNPEDYTHVYIGADDQILRGKSVSQFYELQKQVEVLEDLYAQYSKIPVASLTEGKILEGYQVFKTIGDQLSQWGTLNYNMVMKSVPSGKVDKTAIAGYAKTLGTDIESEGYALKNKYMTTVAKLKEDMNSDSGSDQESMQTKINKAKIALQDSKLKLQNAQEELMSLKTKQQIAKLTAESDLKTAKNKLDDLMDKVEISEELQAAKDALESAQEEIKTTLKQYEDYQIIANFDGLVTKVEMQVGDSISSSNNSSSTEKYIYVETPNLLQVTLDVDQIDIVKISVGMPVQVVLDALSDQTFTGVISEIDTMSESSSYKASVVFQKHSDDQKVLGGMSASVKVTLEQATDAIIVPSPAIADNVNGEKIVRLKKGDQRVDQVVEIGISDDANTQILSGLKVGDVIKGLYINDISMQNAGIGVSADGSAAIPAAGGPGGPVIQRD
ncbi:MAG: HlyD family efflux transporter periplasmic adaptor subunit [candidate division SR1 bacterium]|nr:HlyD family efflux transporter periplasmic adaptor subunit [candidate division SR1 bacterium]